MTPEQTLRLLRDVPGVAGSCLLDPEGRVLIRDLPAEIDDDLVAAVARRADAVLMAASQPLPGAAGVALRFNRLTAFCGRAGQNLLLLLAAPETSTTAVKAAIQMSAPLLAQVTAPGSVTHGGAGAENAGRQAGPHDVTAPRAPRRRGDGIWG